MNLSHTPHRRYVLLLGLAGTLLAHRTLVAQSLTVTGHATLVPSAGRRARDNSGAVIWLNPLDRAAGSSGVEAKRATERYRLVQKNKRFIPHVLVVPAGTTVEFPNYDPFFHNVFSLFDGKRFDLGLYEAGGTRTVTFNTPGISYLFCNIHPEMSAVVIVTKTPYYGTSNAAGSIVIRDVPAGRYQMNVWDERCLPAVLRGLGREVTLSPASSSLGEIRLPESGDILAKHKNKYGRDYDSSASPDSIYVQP